MPYRSVFAAGLFAGRVVIVTGGGSGIGRCTAHELASLGASVCLVGRTASRLDAVAAEIAEDGGVAFAHPCDIREEDQVKATVAAIVGRGAPIYGLVNNAGGQFVKPLSELSVNGLNALLRSNLVGAFLMARECFVQSMAEHGGNIVNVVADYSRGMPGLGHSGASRAGLANLTLTAAVEWASRGVRVNAVAPGYVASSGLDTYPEQLRGFFSSVHRAVPLHRQANVAEISAAICFLLSPGASFVTGAILPIDGAASLVRAMTPWSHLGNAASGLAADFPRPVPEHSRSAPFGGFHRDSTPEVLRNPAREE